MAPSIIGFLRRWITRTVHHNVENAIIITNEQSSATENDGGDVVEQGVGGLAGSLQEVQGLSVSSEVEVQAVVALLVQPMNVPTEAGDVRVEENLLRFTKLNK